MNARPSFAQWLTSGNNTIHANPGNVGVGTNTPNQRLTINGGGIGFDWNSSDKKLYSPNDGDLEWMTHNAAGVHGFAVSHQGEKKIYLNTNGHSYFTGGNLGIGTAEPNSMLTLDGGSINLSTKNGQFSLIDVDNSNNSLLKIGASIAGLNAGDLMLRSYWGVSVDLNDGGLGDNINATHTRIPNTSSFTINRRKDFSSFSTLFTVRNSGNVGIGVMDPDAKLTVNGNIHAREIKVDLSVPGPDYVFEKTYPLRSLPSTEAFIKAHKHLPEIPSAAQMKNDGVNLSEMNMLLLKKVEELTLYLVEKDKEIKALRKVVTTELAKQRALSIKVEMMINGRSLHNKR